MDGISPLVPGIPVCLCCARAANQAVVEKRDGKVVMRSGRHEIEVGEIRCRHCGTPHSVRQARKYEKIERRAGDLRTT